MRLPSISIQAELADIWQAWTLTVASTWLREACRPHYIHVSTALPLSTEVQQCKPTTQALCMNGFGAYGKGSWPGACTSSHTSVLSGEHKAAGALKDSPHCWTCVACEAAQRQVLQVNTMLLLTEPDGSLVCSEPEFRHRYGRPDAELMERFRQRVFQCFNFDAKPRQVTVGT